MKLGFSRDFKKYSNMKFRENPSIGSRFVPRGRTDRRADMMKLIVFFFGIVWGAEKCKYKSQL